MPSTRNVANVVLAVSLAATLFVLSAAPAAADPRLVKRRRLRGGVVYKVYKQRRPALRIRVLKLDLEARSKLRVVLGSGKLPGYETTSSMARSRNAIAAINGDFALSSGRPAMAFARRARLEQTFVLPGGSLFALNQKETRTYVGRPDLRVKITAGAGKARNIARLNNGAPVESQLAMFTTVARSLERTPKRACSARLRRVGGARVTDGGVETVYHVEARRCQRQRMKRFGHTVIATPRGGGKAQWIRSLAEGQRVEVVWAVRWPRVTQAVGGYPTLVAGGRIVVGSSSDSFYSRHPRSGVGRTSNGRVLLVTVDGRQPGYSVGMTPRGFARFFKSLGARWAMNLDGGGSTTTVVNGHVANRPSDVTERPVSSALVIVPGDGATRTTSSVPVDETQAPTEEPSPPAAWELGVLDPASIGGLSSALENAGTVLPEPFEEAASAFAQRWSRIPSKAVTPAAAPEVLPSAAR